MNTSPFIPVKNNVKNTAVQRRAIDEQDNNSSLRRTPEHSTEIDAGRDTLKLNKCRCLLAPSFRYWAGLVGVASAAFSLC